MDQRDLIRIRRRVTSIKGTMLIGALMTAIFLGGFAVWAFTVPLSGAIIARGSIITDGNVQIVRHERGGVLASLSVREGGQVKQGDVIAVLSRAEDQAAVKELETRKVGLRLKQARLDAEMRQEQRLDLDIKSLTDAEPTINPAEIAQLLEDQTREFTARRTQLNDMLEIFQSQRRALTGQIAGLSGELASLRKQRESMATDIALRQQAIRNGLGRESLLREIERQSDALSGNVSKTEAAIEAINHQISETDNRMAAERSAFYQKISDEMSKTRSDYLEISEGLKGKLDATARIEIRSPVTGVVNKLHVNTIGSAVEPFSPLFEIVAVDQPLLIEAKLDPSDVDDVYLRQKARVVISAFNRHLYDQISAQVTFVGADVRQDRADLPPYYTIRLAVDDGERAKIPEIVPGMPSEVFLATHQRTFFEYLAEPFVQSFRRAFRQ